MAYDSYSMCLKNVKDEALVLVIKYFKDNKIVNIKRTPNINKIKRFLDTFSSEVESYSFLDTTLVAKNKDNCKIEIHKYNTLKDKQDVVLGKFDKRIESIENSKKEVTSVKAKNIKVNSNVLLRMKKRALLITTCGLLSLPFSSGLDKCLDNLFKDDVIVSEEVNIELPSYPSSGISTIGIENAVREISISNPLEIHTLVKDDATDENSYSSVIPTFEAKSYEISDEEFRTLVAVVQAEAGGYDQNDRYTDAMAVTSSVLNRLEDSEWVKTCGNTIVDQITFPGQYVGYETTTFQNVYNDISLALPEVIQAVTDTLAGTRNSDFLSFRSKEYVSDDKVQFVKGGNNYFGKSNNKIEDSELNNGKSL